MKEDENKLAPDQNTNVNYYWQPVGKKRLATVKFPQLTNELTHYQQT